jgi:hypothetical protein
MPMSTVPSTGLFSKPELLQVRHTAALLESVTSSHNLNSNVTAEQIQRIRTHGPEHGKFHPTSPILK